MNRWSSYPLPCQNRVRVLFYAGLAGDLETTGPCLKSSSGGTGFLACADRLAGVEARLTYIPIIFGRAAGP